MNGDTLMIDLPSAAGQAPPRSFARPDLSPDERERYEERAAIAEFDGRLSRAEAEQVAAAEIDRARQLGSES
jgi:hypothetical protein